MKRSALNPLAAIPNGGVHDLELSPIKAIELRASRLPDVVSLAQGIPSFDTPAPIKEYVIQKIAEGACAKYSLTPGLPQLREMLAEALLRDGMRYDPDGEIIVTCGAIEAISATLLACVGRGDEVVVTSPTYASYLPAIRLAGATPRFAALNEDANFDLDPEAIARALTRRTRAVLLCNPNNPTGTIYSQAETERLMEIAERNDLLVIDDAVYKDFIYTSEPPGNPAALPAYRQRVVRISSFSKAYGMTGWRVGFLYTDRARADAILKVHDALVTCAPVVSQYAAIAALEFGGPFIAQFRDEFRRRRARVIERLDALPQIFDYQRPNASYFAFPRVKDTVALARNSRALADDILERARVALVPGIAFGPTGEAHLRLCYARDLADIDRAFDRLTDYFAGRSPRAYAPPAPAAPRPPVDRTRRAAVDLLQALARLALKRTRPRIVAIAGGQGNTVLKRTLAELLGGSFRTRSNPLSYNTEIGLAFSILDVSFDRRHPLSIAGGFARALWKAVFPEPVDVMVLELGVRRPGDMRRLLRVIRPDVAILTGVAPSYTEDQQAMGTLRGELQTLVEDVRGRGKTLIVCGDDAHVSPLAAGPNVLRFSRNDVTERDGGVCLSLQDQSYALGREVVGQSSLYAVIASALAARLLGVGEERIRAFLAG